ncbi:glycosyltransferase [Rhizobium sp. LjRoot254]|uniref:glycosyltransferase n=1 Tax=Rhizobium sp. LjRoot254 TaxID=3342297 RepID=UPI003ECE39A2
MQTDDEIRASDSRGTAAEDVLDPALRDTEFNPSRRQPEPQPGALRRKAAELTVVVPTYSEHDNVTELVRRLTNVLAGVDWEVVFVDDDSPDGTYKLAKSIGATDPHIRCIRRVGRRGLSGACIEGILSSSAPVVAVMDADLQHDESLLPQMLQEIRQGADLVIASRYTAGGSVEQGFSGIRRWGSEMATRMAQTLMGTQVSDPMSGFFMIRREAIEDHAKALAGEGYKLLMDILWTAGKSLKIVELSYRFRERRSGESKLDALVTVDYLGLMFSKLFGGVLPVRFLMFGAVGVSGIAVHLLVLSFAHSTLHLNFAWSQFSAVMVAMTWNFVINNQLTYRDARLTGWPFVGGLLMFYLACSIGSVGNVGVASWIYSFHATAWLAGLAGAIIGSVFNYAISSALIWKRK